MWDLGNRGVVALISVPSGCVFLYNVWGPILIVTLSFFLVVYVCYSLVINDSLLSPHAFLLFEYCTRIALEIRANLENIVDRAYRYVSKSWGNARHVVRESFLSGMERRRRQSYRLSSDSYPAAGNSTINSRTDSTRNSRTNCSTSSSGFDVIAELSPISRSSYKTLLDTGSENAIYRESGDPSTYDTSPFGRRSSSSTLRRNKYDSENGETEVLASTRIARKKSSPPMYAQNHTLTRGENTTYFSPEGSPWGTGISPKMRPKASGVKTVQTVAGPLLASTRYNIDPKVYNDVTSPGLTTRLTKYATEANTKLTHQSQYGTGQFPKVNFHACPVPSINAKSMKTRSPVTVRVAPPDAVRYSPSGRQKMMSGLCYAEKKSPPSVVQALKEISLKRHASREDVVADLAKKQRTEGSVRDEFETSDESKQKRCRDESSKSEEDVSPQSKSARPTKRTKTPSCYDILNSLSSSKHVASGVKRKAIDLSRSGTPDFEKHFKSLESTESPSGQSSSAHTLVQPQSIKPKHAVTEQPADDSDVRSCSSESAQFTPLKGILKTSPRDSPISSIGKDVRAKNRPDTQNLRSQSTVSVTLPDSVRLTDKLFMRAEPQRNEKLRMLAEEQGNIRAKFTSDDVEEIKKKDIVDMRQNSMKARLQSMFDAISGKAVSSINPDVVIQAEEVNAVKPAACPVSCATLNSSTTTTNVNTTPISTSAVVPGPVVSEPGTKATKHVAFNVPDKERSTNSNLSVTSMPESKASVVSPLKSDALGKKFGNTFAMTTTTTTTTTVAVAVAVASTPSTSTTNSNLTTQNFGFGKPSPSTANRVPMTAGSFASNAESSNNGNVTFSATTLPANATSSASSSSPFGSASGATPKPLAVPASTSALATKNDASQSIAVNSSQALNNATLGSSFAFGNSSVTPISVDTVATTTAVEVMGVQKPGAASVVNAITPTSAKNDATTSSFGAPTPAFTFGNKSASPPSSKPEAFSGFTPTGSVAQNSNTFKNLTNSQEMSTIGNVSASTGQSVTSTFGPSTATPTFSFGSHASALSANKSAFSFGVAVPGVTSATSATSVSGATTTSNNSVFGSAQSVDNGATAFGTTSANTTSQFGAPPTSIFGNATSGSIFGSTNTRSVFGAPSTTSTTSGGFGTIKTASPPMFGSIANASSSSRLVSSNAAPVFSSTGGSSTGITATNSVPAFGSNVNAPTLGVTATTSNLFSSASSDPTTSAATFVTANNVFGQAKSTTNGNVGANAGVFGSNAATLLFGSQTTAASTFSATNVSTTAPAPAFGSTNVPNNTSVPNFGVPNTATSAFGARSIVTAGAQNPTTQAFGGTGSSVFGTNGTSPTPIFGAAATGGFNSTAANVFGGQNASISFASANNATAFNENKPAPFGGQTVATSPAFGAAGGSAPAFGATSANSGTNNTNIFTFGGNRKEQQQSSSFSFRSENASGNNPASSTSAPFQFGATTSKSAATGFNFSAASTTPSINFGTSGTTGTPTFNASTPGMFSIGSGSTAPRFRNVRSKKPR